MKFKYGEQVKVIVEGFYTGELGTCLRYYPGERPSDIPYYQIKLQKTGDLIEMHESDLKKARDESNEKW